MRSKQADLWNSGLFRKTALLAAVLGGWLCLGSLTAASHSDSEVTNPVSQFPIAVDGLFTDPLEWSDTIPLAFISPPDPAGTLFRTSLHDPAANSFLYTAIAPGVGGDGEQEPADGLYLLYDYLPRTNPFFGEGEFVASVAFPVNLPAELGGGKRPIQVLVFGASREPFPEGASPPAIDSFFDVFLDLDFDGVPNGTPEQLGLDIEAAAGFGRSPHAAFHHLIVELEVSLRIPAGFASPGGALPGNGINPATGLYDPDPVFWGGTFADDRNDPPGTAAVFQINPDGSTTASSGFVPTIFDAAQTKADVISKLEGLLGASGLSKNDRKRLQEAIDLLKDSLKRILPDGTHLDPAKGEKTFEDERKAVQNLLRIANDKKSGIDPLDFLDCIDALVAVDRNLAATAVSDAQFAFGDEQKIAKAMRELSRGDAEADPSNYDPDKAIERYRKAWKDGQKA